MKFLRARVIVGRRARQGGSSRRADGAGGASTIPRSASAKSGCGSRMERIERVRQSPEVGKTVEAARLASVDVEMLRADLKDIVDKANDSDPVFLKKKILELEKKVAAQAIVRDAPDLEELKAIVIAEVNRILFKFHPAVFSMVDLIRDHMEKSYQVVHEYRENLKDHSQWTVTAISREAQLAIDNINTVPGTVRSVAKVPSVNKVTRPVSKLTPPSSNGLLPAGEQKVLQVLAQYEPGLRRTQIGVYSGYTKRSTRDAYIQRLQYKGYVLPDGDKVRITDDGMLAVGEYEELPAGEALQRWWLERLPAGEATILRLLCDAPTSGMTREEISQRSGYEARSTRDAYIQRLSQKMLVRSNGSHVFASEDLF